MELTVNVFLEKLQKGTALPPVVFAWGEEAYFHDKIRNAVMLRTYADTPEADRKVSVFDGDVDLRELAEAINTYPFFADKNLILLRELKILKADKGGTGKTKNDELDSLTDILTNVPEFTQVLCECSAIDKRTKFWKGLTGFAMVVRCESLKPYQLLPWLDNAAAERGGKWGQGAAGLIQDFMGNTDYVPLLLLSKEIDKIATYAGTRTVWTREDVENVFAELPEVSAFALNNAIGEKRTSDVINLLALENKKGTNILPVAGLVAAQIRRLLQVKQMLNCGKSTETIGRELKLHPFVARKTAEQSKHFGERALEDALLAIAKLNIELRRGGRRYERLEEVLLSLLAS